MSHSSGEDLQCTEWWWIDYLENEMEPGCEQDLRLLLEHSQEDRDSFESFRLLREWLRGSDPVANWPVEGRLPRMRAGVMQAIEQSEQLRSEKKRSNYRSDEAGRVATKSLSV